MAAGVAAVGGSNLQIVIIVDVAGRTGNVGVAIGEKESGRAVIKDGGGPANGVVAGSTIRSGKRRASGGMRRIGGLLPLGQVAVLAGARSEIVIIVDVAGRTREIGVSVGELETSGAVIELGAEPAIKTVALVALAGRECRASTMVGRISSVLPIFQVARIALSGQAQELTDGSALMAGIARNGGVSAEKWKAILVILHLFWGNVPALYGVALRAV